MRGLPGAALFEHRQQDAARESNGPGYARPTLTLIDSH